MRTPGHLSRIAGLLLLAGCGAPEPVIVPATGNSLVFPGERWTRATAEEAGLDPAAVASMDHRVGGAGCVVFAGRMVHAWGPDHLRADVGSAIKPLIAHLVFEAVEDGLLSGMDQPVAQHQPALRALNADLGHKDRRITWRHMVTQSSCYGVTEAPGEAFDYSDLQMALLWDTLVGHVHGLPSEEATGRLFAAELAGPIGCQDAPRVTPEGRLRISARDFARIGLLYLAGGRWAGERLLACPTVERATSSPHPPGLPRTAGEPAEVLDGQRTFGGGANLEHHLNSYSYGWWLNGVTDEGERVLPDVPHDAFGAFGHGGRHALVVIPSRGLVIAWVTGLGARYPWRFSVDGRRRVNRALGHLLRTASRAEGVPPARPARSEG